jgi:hypothetical protein
MATLRKEITTAANPDDVWAAIRDVGALHTRLVPGFVVNTKLEPGARMVTFATGLVVRELIFTVADPSKRLVWSTSERLKYHNGSVQVFANPGGDTKVIWIADLLPDEATGVIDQMMEQMRAMKTAMDNLSDKGRR